MQYHTTTTLFQIVLPIAKSVFLVCIGLILLGFLGSLWSGWRQGWAHLRRLHQIPCSNCAFFTDEYNLKFALHPHNALNEAAIGCLGYEASALLQENTVYR